MHQPFQLRINFLGCPSQPDVPWTRENLQKLQSLGFNCVQLNIAWGARPADEPLNLEDVVETKGTPAAGGQSLPLRSGNEPGQVEQRRENLRRRLGLCRELGLRTIFHFGAPYNMHCRFGDNPPNCLADERVLAADLENQGAEEPCRSALRLLADDPRAFVQRYFLVAEKDQASKGDFSVTSR